MPKDFLKSNMRDKVINSDLTEFRKGVLLATLDVPIGKVTTYGTVAKKISCGSSQAIGQALRDNPFAPQVPCHRVVNTQLKLHGFMGQTDESALGKKRTLLQNEGVVFLNPNTISKESLITEL